MYFTLPYKEVLKTHSSNTTRVVRLNKWEPKVSNSLWIFNQHKSLYGINVFQLLHLLTPKEGECFCFILLFQPWKREGLSLLPSPTVGAMLSQGQCWRELCSVVMALAFDSMSIGTPCLLSSVATDPGWCPFVLHLLLASWPAAWLLGEDRCVPLGVSFRLPFPFQTTPVHLLPHWMSVT